MGRAKSCEVTLRSGKSPLQRESEESATERRSDTNSAAKENLFPDPIHDRVLDVFSNPPLARTSDALSAASFNVIHLPEDMKLFTISEHYH
jgi:hypothetical protein